MHLETQPFLVHAHPTLLSHFPFKKKMASKSRISSPTSSGFPRRQDTSLVELSRPSLLCPAMCRSILRSTCVPQRVQDTSATVEHQRSAMEEENRTSEKGDVGKKRRVMFFRIQAKTMNWCRKIGGGCQGF